MKERIIEHQEFGQVLLVKRRGIRRITIKVSATRGIRVTIPWLVPFAVGELFLHQSATKVREALRRGSEAASKRVAVALPEDSAALRAIKKEARTALVTRTRELALQHGFTREDGSPLYGRIALKDNRSNWGSCSAKGNINLNIRLHLLPPHLRDYVILHELCHLRHLNHSPEFHHLLGTLCKEKALRRELLQYDIL